MKDNERKINIDDVLVHSAKFIKDNFIPKKNEESFNIKKKDDKTNVFCIIGESGSGKSFLTDKIIEMNLEKNGNKLSKLVYHTTRQMRENEKEGVDYKFTTNDYFYDNICFDDVIEYREYNVRGQGKVVYFTTKDDLKSDNDAPIICQASPEQVWKYIDYAKREENIKVYLIRIKTKTSKRLCYLFDRCKNEDQEEEAIRRFIDERKEFSMNINNIYNYSESVLEVENTYEKETLDETLSKISNFILNNWN